MQAIEFVRPDGPRSLAATGGDLQRRLGLTRIDERQRQVCYLDTFDWRLHRAGLRLVQDGDMLELSDRDSGSRLVRTPGLLRTTATGDARHLPAHALPEALVPRLAGVVAMRALLPLADLDVRELVLAAYNSDEKIVARLRLTAAITNGPAEGTAGGREPLPLRLSVLPLRGYAKDAQRLAGQLGDLPGVLPHESSLFDEAVIASGRRVGDYTGKLSLKLRRDQSAYDVMRVIGAALLATMRANEAGVVADLDSEFLHDYRVAVRRTRSALKELPGVLAPAAEGRFRQEFKWLGDVTTPTRDLDVYLLTFPDFEAAVGSAAADLAPLQALLVRAQRRAHSELARALRSARYRRLCEDWQALTGDPTADARGAEAEIPIGVLADQRIRKVAARVLRDGDAITADSPAESLHELRKRCKELRYLLEFFATLYDRELHEPVVTALKGLQDNLGVFQDTHVQQEAIGGFADELLAGEEAPAAALLAIGRLVGDFDRRQHRAREEFAGRFATFAAPENRRRLRALTGNAPVKPAPGKPAPGKPAPGKPAPVKPAPVKTPS